VNVLKSVTASEINNTVTFSQHLQWDFFTLKVTSTDGMPQVVYLNDVTREVAKGSSG